MKTSDVSSNKPVQGNQGQTQRTDQKKSGQEFDKVLDQDKPKQQGKVKKDKPFSPLEAKQHKKQSVSSEKESVATASAEGKGEKEKVSGHEQRDYDRIEARGEKETGERGLKKEGSEEMALQLQGNVMQPGMQNVQKAEAVQGVQKPGLNIEEIKSIVNRVDLGINQKGLPEMRFELQTQHLGNIDLKVSAENDLIRIEFATDDINAQKILESNLNELGERLREKGLNLAETRFSQRGQDDAEKQQQQQQQQENQSEFPSSGVGRRRTFNL